MSFAVRRTSIQIEFSSAPEGTDLARAFVERSRNAGLAGKPHLAGAGKSKVKFVRPGRFTLEDLERACDAAGVGEILSKANCVRLRFHSA